MIAVIVGVVTALVVSAVRAGAHQVARRATDTRHLVGLLLLGALGVGLVAQVADWLGADSQDVLFSGQASVPNLLVEDSTKILLVLLVAKALAYGISLGCGFRGGPVFPAIFLGTAIATFAVVWFDVSPTLAVAAGAAAGMAAGTRLLLTSVLFSALLVGLVGVDATPAAVLAAVAAWLTITALRPRTASPAPASPRDGLRQRHDDLGVGAGRLSLPCLGDALERVGLDIDDDLAGCGVTDEAGVVLAKHISRDGVVGEAVDLAHLPADRGRRHRHLAACRLTDLDEAPARCGRQDCGHGGWPPECIDDMGRAFSARCFLECGHEVVGIEVHGCVGAELRRPREPLRIPTRSNDMLGAEELRRLDRDKPDGSGRTEHEHAVFLRNRRTPGNRHPAGHPCDPARDGDLVGHPVGERCPELGAGGCTLGQESVVGETEPTAEQVDTGTVRATTNALAARDERQPRMAPEEPARTDVDVDRVERDGRDLVDSSSPDRLRPFRENWWRTEFADHCGSHQFFLSRFRVREVHDST